MLERRLFIQGLAVAALILCVTDPLARAADSPQAPQLSQTTAAGGTVWGIVTDVKEKIYSLKVDDQSDSIKYTAPDNPDQKLQAALKTIFTVARVQLTYTNNGDVHQITSIKRDMSHPKWTVTGVVGFSNDFWVEVKPKDGPPDGYAMGWGPGGPDKDMAAKLNSLKKGDIVTIKFHSDGERKRIEKLDVVGAVPAAGK